MSICNPPANRVSFRGARAVAYLAWSSGSWSTPLGSGHINSQLSSSLIATVNKNQRLAASTNNRLTGLQNFVPYTAVSHRSLAQNSLLCQIATFKNALIRGCGRHLGAWLKIFARASHAFGLAPPFFKSWIRH